MRFFLLFISFISFSQEQIATGSVLDKDTNAPIPYVNISVMETKLGTSTNENGTYSLSIKEGYINKNIHLSSLGYRDTTITVASFLRLDTILLNPLAEELDEVIIANKKEEHFIEVNKIKKNKLRGGFGSGSKPWIIGLYFPYEKKYAAVKYLNTIKVFINRGKFRKKHKSKFRIRIYDVDEDKKPKDDILIDDLIVNASKEQQELLIDVSEFNITFPKEGLYVALEGLAIPYNAYVDVSTYLNEEGKKISRQIIRYSPSFSATVNKIGNQKVMKYSDGVWWDFDMKLIGENKMFVPAISLTLSN